MLREALIKSAFPQCSLQRAPAQAGAVAGTAVQSTLEELGLFPFRAPSCGEYRPQRAGLFVQGCNNGGCKHKAQHIPNALPKNVEKLLLLR